jgi:outer membrane lipoprotein-sorting protein
MKRFFLCASLLAAALFTKAQTVDDVIAKYVDAMGGKDKLNSIQSLHLTGISTSQNGTEITSDIWKVNNKLYRRVVNFGTGTVTTLITDKGGWQTNFRNGGAFEPMQEQQRNNQLYEMDCAGPLVDYAAKGHKAELIGKETIDGKDCYKIKLTTKEGRELNYYIDAASNYIDRLSYKGRGRPAAGGGGGEEIEIAVNYSKYDKTPDGYTFPFSLATTGGFAGTMTFEKIEVNPKIDDKLYKAE